MRNRIERYFLKRLRREAALAALDAAVDNFLLEEVTGGPDEDEADHRSFRHLGFDEDEVERRRPSGRRLVLGPRLEQSSREEVARVLGHCGMRLEESTGRIGTGGADKRIDRQNGEIVSGFGDRPAAAPAASADDQPSVEGADPRLLADVIGAIRRSTGKHSAVSCCSGCRGRPLRNRAIFLEPFHNMKHPCLAPSSIRVA